MTRDLENNAILRKRALCGSIRCGKEDIRLCRWAQDRSLSPPDTFRNFRLLSDGLSKQDLLGVCKSIAISSGIQLQPNSARPWLIGILELAFCRTSSFLTVRWSVPVASEGLSPSASTAGAGKSDARNSLYEGGFPCTLPADGHNSRNVHINVDSMTQICNWLQRNRAELRTQDHAYCL